MLKIFDSNSHFLQSTILKKEYFSKIKDYNICGSNVTFLPDKPLDFLFSNQEDLETSFNAIPYFSGDNLNELTTFFEIYNFNGIKIHPRFSSIDLSNHKLFNDLFSFACKNKIFIFLCTYYHSNIKYPIVDPLFSISQIKNNFPDLKLVLLHGGDVRLVEFAQFARHFNDVYIDLSYTLTKYNSDYIDSQILFCLNELDEKCLIGSDFPYLGLDIFRQRAEFLTTKISLKKKKNIFYKNAEKMFK